MISKNPAEGVRFLNPRKLSTTNAFSNEEVKRVLQMPDLHTRTGSLHYAILMTLFYCGLRRSELCDLRTVQIGKERGQRVLRLMGKGNKERILVVIPQVWSAILHYFYITRRRFDRDESLFKPVRNNRTGNLDKPLDPSMIFYIVTKYSKQAGVANRVSPHSCRATAISNARDHNVPDRAIQEFAGWASPAMITRYDKRRAAIEESAAHSIRYGNTERIMPQATVDSSHLGVPSQQQPQEPPLYRQMLKHSCVLFTPPSQKVIHGIDISFQSGPTRMTHDSVNALAKDFPHLLSDLTLLSEILHSSQPLLEHLATVDTTPKLRVAETLDRLRMWCQAFLRRKQFEFQDLKIHPEAARTALSDLRESCTQVTILHSPTPTDLELQTWTRELQWDLLTLSNYFDQLRDRPKEDLGVIANTWESYYYYLKFKENIEAQTKMELGNQSRIQYLVLLENLGRTFAKRSFKRLMSQNRSVFTNHFLDHLRHKIRLPLPYSSDIPLPPMRPLEIRKRALKSMLDLCMTLDPTLVCLYPGLPYQHSLLKEWQNSCVGPFSKLCRAVNMRDEAAGLLDRPLDRTYFASLCGN